MDRPATPNTDLFLQTIQACPDLQWSTPDQQLSLALRAQKKSLVSGEHLFHKGDRGESFFLLINGDLEIYSQPQDGMEELILARLFRKGEALGEWAATRENQTRSASVRARGDSALLEISYSAIREIGAFTKFLGHSAKRGEKFESHDELVARSPLLNLMTRQGISRLNYEEKSISSDTIIFELGSPSEEVYLILDGEIEILSKDESVLSTLGQGQIFGELGVSQGIPRSATAKSKGPCKVLVWKSGDFLNLARSNPDFASHIMTLRKIYRTRLKEVVLQFQYQIEDQPCFSSTLQLDTERQLITDFRVFTDSATMEIIGNKEAGILFSYEDKGRNILRHLEIANGTICSASFLGPHPEAGQVVEAMRSQAVLNAEQLQNFEKTGNLFKSFGDQEIVCQCMQLTRSEILEESSAASRSVENVMQKTGAGTVCGGCRGDLATLCNGPDSQKMDLIEVAEFQPGYCRVRFTPDDRSPLRPFIAGQHVRLETDIYGETIRRSYTLTCPASETRWREITFKREPHGIFSRWLSTAKPGTDTLTVSQPTGAFAADMNLSDPVILLVGGIGVTPALSIARTRSELDSGPRIIVDHSFHTFSKGPCHAELTQLADQNPDIEYHPRETLGGQRIRLDHLKRYQSAYPTARWMICGPESYELAVKKKLVKLGIDKESISRELFHARGSTGVKSIPTDRWTILMGITLTVLTIFALGMDLLPEGLKSWQKSITGRWVSGGALLGFLVWQWILPLQRARRSTTDSSTSLKLHRRIGALSPLLLLLHGSSIGAGILGLISVLFLIHTIIGVADRSLISEPKAQRSYLKKWLYPHIIISILLSALALLHVWLILGHGGPS